MLSRSKDAFLNEKVTFQLITPQVHRRNAAERANQMYKNHLITELCTCDSRVPVREWNRIVLQASLTINHLRFSRRNQSSSAYAGIFGEFDFSSNPLASPGTKALIRIKPSNRHTFCTHAIDGRYIGPSLSHTRCCCCYVPKTGTVRHVDTFDFFP